VKKINLLFCLFFSGSIFAQISLTSTVADNGLAAHSITWKDANNLQRNAVLVDQSISGAGYLRKFTYKVSGVDRVCRGTGANGHNGDGFVQNHTAYGGDVSSHAVAGTTSIPLNGTHHSIIDFYMPNYFISNPVNSGGSNGNVPTRVQWFFATGRDYPIYSLMQDARGIVAGNLGADSRSPYGDMHYDGNVNYSSPYTGDLIGGASWGDTHKWVTLTNGTLNESTQASTISGWRYDELNTIPYAMQWTKNIDAEQGRVLTQSIGVKDMGLNSYPALSNVQMVNGPLISDGQWCYQILNYGIVDAIGGVTKRLTWGTNFGYPGGFDEYGNTSLSKTQFTKHSNGTRVNGMLLGYSVFDIFGLHNGNYKNGATGKMVKQMENMQQAAFTSSIGIVKLSGPVGVGLLSNVANNVTYVPAGYNHIYASWEASAQSNIIDVTLTPAASAPVDNPVFVFDNFTAASLGNVCINSVTAIANIDYFATIDAANSKIWITLNRTVNALTRLQINVGTCGVVANNTIGFVGEANANGNKLNWNFINDVGSFEIEKSIDGINFFYIGKVIPSNFVRNTFLDENNISNISYYRIKVINKNTASTFSNIIKLYNKQNGIVLKQNLLNNTIFISAGETKTGVINLYDLQGRILEKITFVSNATISIAQLASGIYTAEIIVGDKKLNKLIIKSF
jgi:hypothetical protein